MKIDETNYIQQLMDKNEKALEFVIREYGWVVKSVVRKQLFHLQAYEEDCINEVFLGAWNNIRQYDPERSSFTNWLAGIARYKSLDYLRKYLRELDNTQIQEDTVAQEDKGLRHILELELSRETEAMLDCLAPKDQELFAMLYLEDRSLDEVSAETGMKKEVIYNRVSRGKKKIRRLFPGHSRGKENSYDG